MWDVLNEWVWGGGEVREHYLLFVMTETNEIGNKWVGRVPISLGHGWFSKQLSCGGSGFLPAGARAEAHIEDNNWSIPATATLPLFRNFLYLSFITKPHSKSMLSIQLRKWFLLATCTQFPSSHWLNSTSQLPGQQLRQGRLPLIEQCAKEVDRGLSFSFTN